MSAAFSCGPIEVVSFRRVKESFPYAKNQFLRWPTLRVRFTGGE